MKRFWIVLSMVLMSIQGFSQLGGGDESKVYVGGDFGISFGTFTYVNVAPEAFYALIPRLHVGGGLSYAFMRDNYYKVSASTYGGKVAARFFFLDQIYAQVEYEGIKYSNSNFVNPTQSIFDESRLLVGGGYRQWIGMNSFTYINLFWNPDAYGPTYFSGVNPVIKFGISIGL